MLNTFDRSFPTTTKKQNSLYFAGLAAFETALVGIKFTRTQQRSGKRPTSFYTITFRIITFELKTDFQRKTSEDKILIAVYLYYR